MNRYDRQTILPEIGASGQAQLTQAHVLVVGAGGLGVPVLQYLAGAGVGRITLVDGDTVDEHNLHRQPLYRHDQIGQPKAEVAAQALQALNPLINIVPLCHWLNPANAPELIAPADVVVDCADTFAVSLTLSDHCQRTNTPLISASALALSGYVLGCCGNAPSLRAVFPDLPERSANCATAGVMGPVVASVGALQAQMTLAVLLRLSPSPLGQLINLDAAHWRMSGFRFDSAPEPEHPLSFIARSDLDANDLLIDLRVESTPFCATAQHIPPEAIGSLQPPLGARVVLACATGLRAHNAGQILQANWSGSIALLALNQ